VHKNLHLTAGSKSTPGGKLDSNNAFLLLLVSGILLHEQPDTVRVPVVLCSFMSLKQAQITSRPRASETACQSRSSQTLSCIVSSEAEMCGSPTASLPENDN